ncbi:MAG TPA: ATP-dependent sacrificial sulfur transferase LarE [Thermodesulfovibrionales bacterium]|nr:ATP-dependent sacrificial sulfur transferase LarE [Thermodesulfovibrionales bacterium]
MSTEKHGPHHEKFSRLLSLLQQTESAVLAFSGGVDSSFLLRALKMAGVRFLAVTGYSETVPEKDIVLAGSFAEQEGVEHRVINTGEMQNELFIANTPERCFYCKQDLFCRLREIAGAYDYRALFDGSNADDLNDFRPGRKAASLYGVRSPLAECGLSKQDIRLLSRELGLETWDRPASPCLSSRFPYGQRITPDLLKRVEKAEEFLKSIGMKTVRVRMQGEDARIELPGQDMSVIVEEHMRSRITKVLHALGFAFVSLDLDGFRSGSMNRSLPEELRRNRSAV